MRWGLRPCTGGSQRGLRHPRAPIGGQLCRRSHTWRPGSAGRRTSNTGEAQRPSSLRSPRLCPGLFQVRGRIRKTRLQSDRFLQALHRGLRLAGREQGAAHLEPDAPEVRTLPECDGVRSDGVLVPTQGEERGRLAYRGGRKFWVRLKRALEVQQPLFVAARARIHDSLVQEGEGVAGTRSEHLVEARDRTVHPSEVHQGDPFVAPCVPVRWAQLDRAVVGSKSLLDATKVLEHDATVIPCNRIAGVKFNCRVEGPERRLELPPAKKRDAPTHFTLGGPPSRGSPREAPETLEHSRRAVYESLWKLACGSPHLIIKSERWS